MNERQVWDTVDRYDKVFDDLFPTIPLLEKPYKKVIEIINRCISEKKDVYKLEYLSENVIY